MAKWKIKTLLIKRETTYGTDPVPVAATDAVLAYNIDLSPMEGEDLKREYESVNMGARGSVPVGLYMRLAFSLEMTPSGSAGVAPAFSAALRACACSEVIVATTSVTYARVSQGQDSAAFHVWIDGVRYQMLGGRGNAKLNWEAKKYPMIDFEFTGLWAVATDQSNPTPALATQIARKPQPVTSVNTPTFTVNGVALKLQKLVLDLGNKVSPRFLPRGDGVIVEDFEETLDMTVEAEAMAAFNPYALANAQTLVPLSLVHGLGAGRITTLAIPNLQLMRPGKPSQSQGVVEWALRGSPVYQAGNDQLTLALT